MQRPDPKKRELIKSIAAKLFATRPFHEVRLDDVAAAAKVGKGTVYTYFPSKEDLYFALLEDGFSSLIDRMRDRVEGTKTPPREDLRLIIRGLVDFAIQNPYLFEVMRSAGGAAPRGGWCKKRDAMVALIEATIRRGIAAHTFHDPDPHLTALCVPGLVRSVFLYGPRGLKAKQVTDHLVRLLEGGIDKKGGAS
jgi:AcrR family transcriptional regulator